MQGGVPSSRIGYLCHVVWTASTSRVGEGCATPVVVPSLVVVVVDKLHCILMLCDHSRGNISMPFGSKAARTHDLVRPAWCPSSGLIE